jgi:hypothetical protein
MGVAGRRLHLPKPDASTGRRFPAHGRHDITVKEPSFHHLLCPQAIRLVVDPKLLFGWTLHHLLEHHVPVLDEQSEVLGSGSSELEAGHEPGFLWMA